MKRFPTLLLVALSMLLPLSAKTTSAGTTSAGTTSAPVRVACIGDSITQGIGTERGKSYPNQLQALLGDHWLVGNFGVGGRTLLREGDFPYWKGKALQLAQDFQPKVVVIMLGTNDTKSYNWSHHDHFLADYRDLVNIFRQVPSKPRILICKPCPVPEPGNYGINEANIRAEIELIEQLAKEEGLQVIDIHAALESFPQLFPDRVHPNTEGAGIIAKTVAAAIADKELKK